MFLGGAKFIRYAWARNEPYPLRLLGHNEKPSQLRARLGQVIWQRKGAHGRLFRPNAQRESIAPVDRTALAEAPSASVHRELSLIGHHQLRNEHSHNWISRLHVDHSGIGRRQLPGSRYPRQSGSQGSAPAVLDASHLFQSSYSAPARAFRWDARRDEAETADS
jgi:hypothetical protein